MRWQLRQFPGPSLLSPLLIFVGSLILNMFFVFSATNRPVQCTMYPGSIIHASPRFFPLIDSFSEIGYQILGRANSCLNYRTRVRSLAMLVSNSLTHWLTDSLTHCHLVNLIDVTLSCEDAYSKLVEVVTVADEDRVGNSLLQIWKLRFGQKA